MRIPTILLAVLFLAPPLLAAEVESPVVLRGDRGVLMALRPSGVAFIGDSLGEDLVLVCDYNANELHLFDLRGRRFKLLDHPQSLARATYAGLAPLGDSRFLVVGSHYHEKNTPHLLYARSVIHLLELRGEDLTPDSAERNLSPDRPWRKTRLWGSSPKERMEISGIAVDGKRGRVFFGLARPLDEKRRVRIFETELEALLGGPDEDLPLRPVNTGLVPETDPTTRTSYYLSDLTYVPERGLLVLLASESRVPGGPPEFGANQIWLLPGGSGPAVPVLRGIAPGDRASGVAARREGDGYTLVLTLDNDPEQTGRPSRLVRIRDVRL